MATKTKNGSRDRSLAQTVGKLQLDNAQKEATERDARIAELEFRRAEPGQSV